MARLVRHTATDPIKIDPAAPAGAPNAWPRDEQGNLKPVFVCACGISGKYPICDGSHKTCRLEEPGCTYTYDATTKQVTSKTPS